VPRTPRFSYPRAVHHVTLRCNNREFLFSERSFELFHSLLQKARERFGLSLYNYCLMTNHVHLLFKVNKADTLSSAMHWTSSLFSRRFNKQSGRNGHLWEGRFRSTIIEESSYFLRCMTYLDLNPVRARMVAEPAEHRWSGHRALRHENAAELDFHPTYLELGTDARSRYRAYTHLLAEDLERRRVPLATKFFVGSPRFVARMETKFGLSGGGTFLAREAVATDAGGAATIVSLRPRVGRAARQ